jgi:hypothetical protein
MSAKWLRIDIDFVDHPKIKLLAGILKVTNSEAGWSVLRVWSWMSRFCPMGHVPDMYGTTLASECGPMGHVPDMHGTSPGHVPDMHGTSLEFMSALVSAGLFDAKPNGNGWEAHDWHEYQGQGAVKSSNDATRKAIWREKQKLKQQQIVRDMSHDLSHGTNGTVTANVTERNVTERIKEDIVDCPLFDDEKISQSKAQNTPNDLQTAWNANRATTMPEWKGMSEKRRTHAISRLEAHTIEELTECVIRLAKSDFASGRNGKWAANPNWFVASEENVVKILEGNYDNRVGTVDPRKPQQPSIFTETRTVDDF